MKVPMISEVRFFLIAQAKRLLRMCGVDFSRYRLPENAYLLTIPRYESRAVQLLGKKFQVADGTSYYWSHREIFGDEIYRFKTSKVEPRIIDCGSNYGTSIIYYKSVYPRSKITAVEADPEIFRLLRENINTRDLSDVTLVNKALSFNRDPVRFYREGADGGRLHRMDDTESVAVEAIRLDDLIDGEVDFLKIDIEGAEADVICSACKLRQVDQLFVEYHSFADSEQRLHDILYKMSKEGFRYYVHSQFCSPRPLVERKTRLGMDLQLNLFFTREQEDIQTDNC